MDSVELLAKQRELVARSEFDLTRHAHELMAERDVTVVDLKEVFASAQVLEDYENHERGPCWLLCGEREGRFVHIVCTKDENKPTIITVYEPEPPAWNTPYERGTQT